MTILNLSQALVVDIRLMKRRPNRFSYTYDVGAMYLGGTSSREEFYGLRCGLETVEGIYKKFFD